MLEFLEKKIREEIRIKIIVEIRREFDSFLQIFLSSASDFTQARRSESQY
jgi:hypothetical protein